MVTSVVPCLIIGELWGPTVRISNQNCCFGCNISVHDTKYGHTVPFGDGMLQGSQWTFSLCWVFRRVYQGTSSPAGNILSSESTVFPVLSKHVCFAENSLLGSWLTVPEERIQCTVSGYCPSEFQSMSWNLFISKLTSLLVLRLHRWFESLHRPHLGAFNQKEARMKFQGHW